MYVKGRTWHRPGRRPAVNHRSSVDVGGVVAGLDQASKAEVAAGLDPCPIRP
jgi:hypothetical protein